MIVSLARTGGFTGLRVRSTVDTDDLTDLPGDRVTAAVRALEELASAPPEGPPAGAGQPVYRLTLQRPSGAQVVELVEAQVPDALRPLLTELVRRAGPGA
ncbi:MAG: protealysin inhibitor emfourin [Nocardioidaceae bacterium]